MGNTTNLCDLNTTTFFKNLISQDISYTNVINSNPRSKIT